MLSYLLFVVSMVNSGFVSPGLVEKNLVEKNLNAELNNGGEMTTGGLIVKMGPVMNLHVAAVRVLPGEVMGKLPTIAHKGSLFQGFSHNRVYAIRYGK
jgi:hypothetical protein